MFSRHPRKAIAATQKRPVKFSFPPEPFMAPFHADFFLIRYLAATKLVRVSFWRPACGRGKQAKWKATCICIRVCLDLFRPGVSPLPAPPTLFQSSVVGLGLSAPSSPVRSPRKDRRHQTREEINEFPAFDFWSRVPRFSVACVPGLRLDPRRLPNAASFSADKKSL